jgi:hypothetical protein
MNEAVGCLDARRIGEFLAGLIFEDEGRAPRRAVARNRDVQNVASRIPFSLRTSRVVVDEQEAAIGQRDRIDS